MSGRQENIDPISYAALERMSFKLGSIERIEGSGEEWSLRLHFLDAHMLLFVASGQGWMTVDGRFVELRSGAAYIGCPGQLIEVTVHSLDERGLYHMSFDVLEQDESMAGGMRIVKQDSAIPVRGVTMPLSPVSVGVLCETISEYWQSENGLKRFGGQIRFQELLFTIMQDDWRVQETDYDASLESVKDYIEQHYKEKITIEALAKVARISPRHFMRLFKQKYGCSAIEYLAVYRIKQAQLLMMTDRKHLLKDIARHVGYQDDIYFRRKFKQVSGIPPAAFMRNSRQKIAAYHPVAIGMLIALQIFPSAAPESHPWTDYYRRKYAADKVIPLSTEESARLEQLRLAKPEFILTVDDCVSREEHERLSEIAPVCSIPWANNDWRTHLRFVARFLNRTEVAEAWLERYERKAAMVKEQIANTIKEDRLLIVKVHGDRLEVLGPHSIASVFHEDLRIAQPSGAERLWRGPSVTVERLSELDADRLLLIVEEDAQSQAGWRSLMRHEQWRGLPAVRSGRVDYFPASPLNEYTAFTHELVLDEVMKLWRDRA
jgi:ABC-type Fe3+-hydroxamate transport system substrate-binding protein/AraC-like DNA-binding protein